LIRPIAIDLIRQPPLIPLRARAERIRDRRALRHLGGSAAATIDDSALGRT
jgi:hypothetical protein